LFTHAARIDTTMKYKTFSEELARRDEGFLLPNRPPLKRMAWIHTTPFADAQRKRLHPKKVKPPKPFAPTVQKVKEVVPNRFIRKLNPTTPQSPPLSRRGHA
jgi:hypothetical protein